MLGTVASIPDAVQWLGYTYLHVRMRKNPMVYGISYDALAADAGLLQFRRDLLAGAARQLDKSRMVRYDIATGYLNATDLGRVASHFYIKHASVEVFNEFFELLQQHEETKGISEV